MVWPFRRRKSRTAAVLQAPRAGMERIRDALPETHLTDTFLELASRTGIDLGDLVQRGVDRLGDVATRAGEGAGGIKPRRTGKQAREIAERARTSVADLASRAGAERLSSTIAPKRPSRTPLVLGLLSGLAAGGILAYFLAPRQGAQLRARLSGRPARSGEEMAAPGNPVVVDLSPVEGGDARSMPKAAMRRVTAPPRNALDALRRRYTLARGEAKLAQDQTARDLWREYDRDVRHIDEQAMVTRELKGGGPV